MEIQSNFTQTDVSTTLFSQVSGEEWSCEHRLSQWGQDQNFFPTKENPFLFSIFFSFFFFLFKIRFCSLLLHLWMLKLTRSRHSTEWGKKPVLMSSFYQLGTKRKCTSNSSLSAPLSWSRSTTMGILFPIKTRGDSNHPHPNPSALQHSRLNDFPKSKFPVRHFI